jgi:hypothetical protein
MVIEFQEIAGDRQEPIPTYGASITVEKFGHMPEVKFMLNKAMEMGGFTAYHPKGALKELQLSTRPEPWLLLACASLEGTGPDDMSEEEVFQSGPEPC